MPTPQSEWLASNPEAALEPELPICDPHHHLWVHEANPYMLPELSADVGAGHNVVSTVFVECTSGYRVDGPAEMRPVGETEFVEKVALQSLRGDGGPTQVAAGIVSFADLTLGARVETVLAAHQAASPDRFRGIRHASSWDASDKIRNSHTNPPPELLADPSFREGLKCLGRMGFSFDAWLYHPQIPELTALATACPDVPIVLDHVGGPLGLGPYAGQQDVIFPAWQANITALAQCPNVSVKLGGLAMPVNGFGWHKGDKPPSSEALAQSQRRYMHHCIEQFGADRCMFESNFPVDKVSCSYTTLWNAFKRLASGATDAEKSSLFHDTAARFYRLS